MKHYKNFLIVGIDHGYGNIKTANTVTLTGITKLDAAPTFTKNTLFFDGCYYLIGEGHKEYLPDKWEDNDNYLFTLMGIARELNREGINTADVQLAVGLPLTWVNRQREDFRKYMLQRERVEFKYEDKIYSVRIIGCYVFPQGYAAVVPNLNEMIADYQQEKDSLNDELDVLMKRSVTMAQDESDVDEYIRRLKSYAGADTLTRKMVLDLLEYVTVDEYVDRKTPRNIHIYYKLIDKPLRNKNNALA